MCGRIFPALVGPIRVGGGGVEEKLQDLFNYWACRGGVVQLPIRAPGGSTLAHARDVGAVNEGSMNKARPFTSVSQTAQARAERRFGGGDDSGARLNCGAGGILGRGVTVNHG